MGAGDRVKGGCVRGRGRGRWSGPRGPLLPPPRRRRRHPSSLRGLSRHPSTTTPTATPVPRFGTLALSDIRFLRRLGAGAGDIGGGYLAEVKLKPPQREQREDKTKQPAEVSGVLVVAKVMFRKELAGRKKDGRARTEREILEAVDHPFLPRLYGVADGDRWSCLLTNFCLGNDLHVLRQSQPHRRFSEAAVSQEAHRNPKKKQPRRASLSELRIW